MAEISPKWAMSIYAQLWVKFKNHSFSREQAERIVKSNNLSQAFSNLKKNGWLRIELDPHDSRRSIYTLNNPVKVIEIIGNIS